MTAKKANTNYTLIDHKGIGKSTILHKVKLRLESHEACCIPVYVYLG